MSRWPQGVVLLIMGLLAACEAPTHPTATPPPIAASLPSAPTETQVTYEPTYVAYARAFDATALAIIQTLPTPSPQPNLRFDLQESAKRRYLWAIAAPTASALFPPPANFDPRSEITPFVQLTPDPTEPPPPHRETSNGTIYDAAPQDDPSGKLLYTVNFWLGSVADHRARVYAGHVKGMPNQGVIVVEVSHPEQPGGTNPTRMYETPRPAGAVRVMDVTGTHVTLEASDGTNFIFDLGIQQWVNL
jgi:hypothetical protein